MTIIQHIFKQMGSDSEDQSESLETKYVKADQKERKVMDSVMMNVCGWTLATLINSSDSQITIEEDGFGHTPSRI